MVLACAATPAADRFIPNKGRHHATSMVDNRAFEPERPVTDEHIDRFEQANQPPA